jgi:hypothetical protein
MHRTLKEAAVVPPAASLNAQQHRFNRFVAEDNDDRSPRGAGAAHAP